MIVKMSRVYIAVSKPDRDELLNRLGKMNLLHFEPVKPDKAVPDEITLREMADLELAIGILSAVDPVGPTPAREPLEAALNPLETALEAVEIQRSIAVKQERINDLYRREKDLKIWGDVRLSQFHELRRKGVEVRFFQVPRDRTGEIKAECSEIISPLPGKRVLTAVVDRSRQFEMPEDSEPVSLPSQDRASILAEAEEIDRDLKQARQRLSQLALFLGALDRERARLRREAAFTEAQRSGLSRGELFAVKGWLPSEEVRSLEFRLSGDGFPVAVHMEPVTDEDAPPTLIRYSSWARPIKALFDMLGTFPGYREMDLSPFFMIGLPVFAAMLIGDAGYGFLITLGGMVFYRRLVRLAGRPRAQIIIIFGLTTLAWGILTANYFGLTPADLAGRGEVAEMNGAAAGTGNDALRAGQGIYSRAGDLMKRAGPLWREDPEEARFLMIRVSLIIGCLHLIMARLRKMVELIPDRRFLAEIGWIVVLADMLVLIWYLLFIGVERVPRAVWWVLLAAFLLASWFGRPSGNALKRLVLGLSSSMLPLLNTFSDTMSYLRLFAVGLASYFIASAFNTLAVQVAETATWPAAIPVLIFGHGLNLGLAIIAIFAHGVRLNMLEFSNNVGVQWAGYAYRPFTLEKEKINHDQF